MPAIQQKKRKKKHPQYLFPNKNVPIVPEVLIEYPAVLIARYFVIKHLVVRNFCKLSSINKKNPTVLEFLLKSIFYKKTHKYLGGGKNLYEITPCLCPVSGGNFVQIFASTKFLCIFL